MQEVSRKRGLSKSAVVLEALEQSLMAEGAVAVAGAAERWVAQWQGQLKLPEGKTDQAKKGNQWHFGMKVHIGVDRDSGLMHTLRTCGCDRP